MGRGDKKSRKGKIFKGSYGNSRPKKIASTIVIPPKKEVKVVKEEVVEKVKVAKKVAPKKTTTKKATAKKTTAKKAAPKKTTTKKAAPKKKTTAKKAD